MTAAMLFLYGKTEPRRVVASRFYRDAGDAERVREWCQRRGRMATYDRIWAPVKGEEAKTDVDDDPPPDQEGRERWAWRDAKQLNLFNTEAA